MSIYASSIPHFAHPIRTISYADPDVGGGKTYGLEQVISHPFHGKAIIGIQSIYLAKEIEAKLKSLNIAVLRIDTEAFPYKLELGKTLTCREIFNDALKANRHQVFIVNQDVALSADPAFSHDYALYMDEVPAVYERIFLDGIVTSQAAFKSYLTSKPVDGKEGILIISTTDEAETFLKTEKLEKQAKADKKMFETIQKIADYKNYDVYVEAKVWNDFRLGLEQKLVFHSIMKPTVFDRFQSPTILGANFTKQLMKLIWSSHYKVEFSENQSILEHCRYRKLSEHFSGPDHVKIFYHSEKNCSKTKFKEIDYQPTFDASCAALQKLLGDLGYPADTKSLVFLNNKPSDVKEKFVWNDQSAELLSPAARGWDAFKEVDVAVYLAACNEHPDTYRVLNVLFGLNKRQVDEATCLERVYQAMGRCSLRDKDRAKRTDKPVVLVFFEERAARYVADIIGCDEPVFLDTGIAALGEIENKTTADYDRTKYHKRMSKEIADLEDYDGFSRRLWKNMKTQGTLDHASSWAEWCEISQGFHETVAVEEKHMAVMYREGMFLNSDTLKTKGNIVKSKLITLDFDEVHANPADLSRFLSGLGITSLIINSFRSTHDAPRIRVDIPLSAPVNAYGYTHIVNHLMNAIDAEFGAGAFVLDTGKAGISAKFFTPSISVFHADLFLEGTVWNDGQPVFLSVADYMAKEPIVKEKADNGNARKRGGKATGKGSMTIEEVLDKRSVPEGFEKAWENFCQAAVDLLFSVNLSREETIQVLHENRYRFGKGHDRDAVGVVDWVLSKQKAA